MSAQPFGSSAQDQAIAAMLPHIALHGWSAEALRAAGQPTVLFDGPAEMIEAYLDWADRRMQAAAGTIGEDRLGRRVRALIALRFAQAREERTASRRAAAWLALPGNAGVALRTLARTVDAIWHAADDRSADFAWYTKRASLAAVYAATLAYWLGRTQEIDPDDAATLAFLDRRLAGLARIGRLRSRFAGKGPEAQPSLP